MLIICAYDIENNRRRTRLFKTLSRWGHAVQRSVFECEVSVAQFAEMQGQINQVISANEDDVRFYEICAACRERVRTTKAARRVHVPRVAII